MYLELLGQQDQPDGLRNSGESRRSSSEKRDTDHPDVVVVVVVVVVVAEYIRIYHGWFECSTLK